jgi:hypothetical protein
MSASGKAPERSGLWTLAATPLRAIADRLFRNDDARARQHGWQVTARRGGLSRAYRDPRFDLLQACPSCFGTGPGHQNQDCDRCAGSGRIMLAAKLSPEAGRGR